MSDKKVVVYSSQGCVACGQVKDLLAKKGVAFTERNIVEDEAALDELAELGALTTPVTVIDGQIVTGYSRRTLEQLLDK
jgi:glutaredoxin-like protein NrdH